MKFTILIAFVGILALLFVSAQAGGGHHHGGGGGYNGGHNGPIDEGSVCEAGANYPMHGDHEFNGDGCWQLQYSGGFAPNEFVRFTPGGAFMDGIAVRVLRSVEETTFPPNQCFDHVRDSRFSTIWRSVDDDTTWGENLQNGASNVDLSNGWGCSANRELTLRCGLPVVKSGAIALFCGNCTSAADLDDLLISGTIVFAAGFENDIACLRSYAASEGLTATFTAIVGPDNEADVLDLINANENYYAFLRANAPANPNDYEYVDVDPIKCSEGYGPLSRKDDEAIMDAVDCGIRNLSNWVYARDCCAPYLEPDLATDLINEGSSPGDWFDQCFKDGERPSDDDGPELPASISAYSKCCEIKDDCMQV